MQYEKTTHIYIYISLYIYTVNSVWRLENNVLNLLMHFMSNDFNKYLGNGEKKTTIMSDFQTRINFD